MEIITRDAAITLRLTKYFTGKPCKRAHISSRYVKNSACVECLHPTYTSVDREQRDQLRARRLAARTQMTKGRYCLHPDDIELFKATVYARALSREPLLRLEDIETRCVPEPRNAPFMVHTYWIFPDDSRMLIEFQTALSGPRERAMLKPACKHSWTPDPTGQGRASLRCVNCCLTNY
jgi:hypothetical protein